MAAAIELQRLGIDDFVVLERRDDVGGTWRDNTYPGVAVDIPSFTYSSRFAQNPHWSRIFAPGAELQKYAHDIADRHRLRRHLRLGTEVRAAEFDESHHLRRLTLADGDSVTEALSATTGQTPPLARNPQRAATATTIPPQTEPAPGIV
ncbi:NAD(P)-binding protein [Nocardia uniformis]|nr:NAD(P)-binding protein [Nocardia uniformis]